MLYSKATVFLGEISMINPVTCLFSLFEALNNVFKVHFFKA